MAGAAGQFTVTGSHTYVTSPPSGSFATTVTLADTSGVPALVAKGVASVAPASTLTPLGQLVVASASSPINSTTVIGSFLDSNTNDLAANFQAIISWGDGQQSAGTVVANPSLKGRFDVTGTHTYANPGTYMASVDAQDRPGHAVAIASQVTVVSASLNATATNIPVAIGQPFTAVVARFTDTSPLAMAGGTTAVIDWGDGHSTIGTVTGPDASGQFSVIGTYDYPSAQYPANANGAASSTAVASFPVNVTITDAGGLSAVAKSTALVANSGPSFGFSGGLAPSSDTGPLHQGTYTNTNRPSFAGTTTPFALVQLFARPAGIDANIPLGQTIAGPAGQWNLTVGPLLDGYYTVSAVVTPSEGYPSIPTTPLANGGALVVDTAPPRVVGVTLLGRTNQVLVTFQDDLSGLNLDSLRTPTNYAFLGPHSIPITPVAIAPRFTGILPTDAQSVVLTSTLNPRLRGKLTVLQIINAGITDLAGNTLKEGFPGRRFGPIVGRAHPVAVRPARGRRR